MKYFVMMVDKDNKTFYKKNKCVNGWSTNKSECWAFSASGARKIAVSLYAFDKSGGANVYDYIPSYGMGKNERGLSA